MIARDDHIRSKYVYRVDLSSYDVQILYGSDRRVLKRKARERYVTKIRYSMISINNNTEYLYCNRKCLLLFL